MPQRARISQTTFPEGNRGRRKSIQTESTTAADAPRSSAIGPGENASPASRMTTKDEAQKVMVSRAAIQGRTRGTLICRGFGLATRVLTADLFIWMIIRCLTMKEKRTLLHDCT